MAVARVLGMIVSNPEGWRFDFAGDFEDRQHDGFRHFGAAGKPLGIGPALQHGMEAGSMSRLTRLRVRVIGAGVAGLACALELADRGAEVEIIDRGSRLGDCSCSWFAGGMLAPWCELATAEPLVAELGERSIAWWCVRR